MAGPRTLRVLVRAVRGALPTVIAASVAPLDGCNAGDAPAQDSKGRSAGSAAEGMGRAGGGVVAGGGGTSMTGVGGPAGSVSPPLFDAGSIQRPVRNECMFKVELPPEGVPAEPGQICAARMSPVDANRAARVRLEIVKDDLRQMIGTIDVAPSLNGTIMGLPQIEIIDATDPSLLALTVDVVEAAGTGFRFAAHWGGPISVTRDGFTRITVRVSLDAICEQAPQVIHSVTDVHLCSEFGDVATWVSSGSVCSVCRVIAEMAPSPIVPDGSGDDLPLARVLRLRVVELARISGTVVLLAEHDGGPGLEYEWSASSGAFELLAPDVIALTAPEGVRVPFVQVAAFGSDAAAVASWAFNDQVS